MQLRGGQFPTAQCPAHHVSTLEFPVHGPVGRQPRRLSDRADALISGLGGFVGLSVGTGVLGGPLVGAGGTLDIILKCLFSSIHIWVRS